MRAPILAAIGLAMAMSAGPWARADNTIGIRGSGGGSINIDASGAGNSAIDIYQVSDVLGARNQAGTDSNPIVQSGSGHTARIGQGATHDGGEWTRGAAVEGNSAGIVQNGGVSDRASIYQSTSHNLASVRQSASHQNATVIQDGAPLNQATLIQNGSAALTATIVQNGAAASTLVATQGATDAYTLNVTQGGAGGHYAEISTTGYTAGGTLSVNQTGSANTAYVAGMSGGSAAVSQSGSNGYLKLENQTSGALTVSQEGSYNALTISNYGAGAAAGQALSVTQTGIGSGTTAYSPDPAPTGPTYSTAPPP